MNYVTREIDVKCKSSARMSMVMHECMRGECAVLMEALGARAHSLVSGNCARFCLSNCSSKLRDFVAEKVCYCCFLTATHCLSLVAAAETLFCFPEALLQSTFSRPAKLTPRLLSY